MSLCACLSMHGQWRVKVASIAEFEGCAVLEDCTLADEQH